MFRTMLRVLGGVLSLVSFATLMTTRGPGGEPSVLERIPAIMDALEARVAARKAGAATTAGLPSQGAFPEPYGRTPGPPLADEPSPPADPALLADGPTWRLPSDAGGVKVNRGLP